MNADELFVSIVVPCYNEERKIRKCIESVLACAYERTEIIGVDDSSTDSTISILNEYSERGLIRCIRRNERGGTIRAINAGVRAASGSIIGIVPGDSYVDRNWLERAVTHFRSGGDVIAVGGPLKSVQGGYWGRCGELLDNLLLSAGLEVALLPGANMFIKSGVLSALGFFDERIKVGEDFDMNIRLKAYAKKTRGRVIFDEELKVYTSYPKSLVEEAKRRFRWGIGRSRALVKNKEMNVKAWVRAFYTPTLLSLFFLTVMMASMFSSLQLVTISMLIIALLLPGFIPILASRLNTYRKERPNIEKKEFAGIVLLAYTRLIFGSLGSLWGLVRS